jgi:hypothetical protein
MGSVTQSEINRTPPRSKRTSLRRRLSLPTLLGVLVAISASLALAPAALASGTISGTVTDASSHVGIPDIEVCGLLNGETFERECTPTGSNGEYALTLQEGEYIVEFAVPTSNESANYLPQFYNNTTEFHAAAIVSVTSGSSQSAVDAAMQPGGKITGTVTELTGAKKAIPGIEVCAENTAIIPGERCADTNAGGTYTITSLVTGEYTVKFFTPNGSPLNFAPQSRKASATAGSTTSGIDAAMHVGGSITGKVTAPGFTSGFEGEEVCARGGAAIAGCAITGANGDYDILSLATGMYGVELYLPSASSLNYAGQDYPGTVSVTEGSAKPLSNVELHVGGQVTGRVTNAATSGPIEGIEVCASGITGVGAQVFPARCVRTNGNGEYTVKALTTGAFDVGFTSPLGLSPQYTEKEIVPVEVTEGSTTSGVNAALQPIASQPSGGGGGTTTAGTTKTAAATTATTSTSTSAATLTVSGVPTVKAGAVTYTLTCTGPAGSTCKATGTLTLTETLKSPGNHVASVSAAKKKKKTVTVGSQSTSIAAGKSVTVTVALNGAGRKLLAQFGKLPAHLTIESVSSTGAQSTLLTKTLTVKPAKKTKKKH